ncbi:MAG: hypothetical protein AAF634_07005, partial [Bacteroidota bacterium]
PFFTDRILSNYLHRMILTEAGTVEKTRNSIAMYLVLLLTLAGACEMLIAQTAQSTLDTTRYFSFHNNYWINLHHFLYEKASGDQLAKLKQDGNEMLVIGETTVEKSLTPEQRSNLDGAIEYYKENIIQKGLLRGLGYERYWLQRQMGGKALADSTVSQEFVDVLNRVSNTYGETYWPIHKKHNEAILEFQIPNISKLEKRIIPRMEQLSLTPWPSGGKVRVDLTVYANYAGAYTPTRPIFNVIVSTIDPSSYGPEFLETIFHEGSHLLFRYGGTWRERIFENFEQEAYSINFPRHLWHASLFYLCGQVCKDEFSGVGITNYEMTMKTRNIFRKYHNDAFYAVLDNYLEHKCTFQETVSALLEVTNKLPKVN